MPRTWRISTAAWICASITRESLINQRLFKAGLVILLSLPLAWLAWLIYLETQLPGSGLGADPREGMVHYLGEWSIRSLLLAFSVTPLRRMLGQPLLARNRRLVGLFAFSYVALHLLSYLVLYIELDWGLFLEDLVERSYITAGIAAFICLLPMAITSTRGWQRRLRQGWRRLHKLIYVAVAAAIIHLVWLTKDDYADSVIYSAWALIMVGERIYTLLGARRPASAD